MRQTSGTTILIFLILYGTCSIAKGQQAGPASNQTQSVPPIVKIIPVDDGLLDKDIKQAQNLIGEFISGIMSANRLSFPFTPQIVLCPAVEGETKPDSNGIEMIFSAGSITRLNDSQFAFVVAHELAHIALHHQRNEEILLKEANSIPNDWKSKLKYGRPNYPAHWFWEQVRQMDLEADYFGGVFSAKAGYDPAAGLSFFSLIQQDAEKLDWSERIRRHFSGGHFDASARREYYQRALPGIEQIRPVVAPRNRLAEIRGLVQKAESRYNFAEKLFSCQNFKEETD